MFPITVGELPKVFFRWVNNYDGIRWRYSSGAIRCSFREVTGTTPDTVQVIQQSIDNDTLSAIADKLEVTNTLLLGINDRLDFIIALGVAIVFVAVCYSILKGFSRF